jgi:hypothetical protein
VFDCEPDPGRGVGGDRDLDRAAAGAALGVARQTGAVVELVSHRGVDAIGAAVELAGHRARGVGVGGIAGDQELVQELGLGAHQRLVLIVQLGQRGRVRRGLDPGHQRIGGGQAGAQALIREVEASTVELGQRLAHRRDVVAQAPGQARASRRTGASRRPSRASARSHRGGDCRRSRPRPPMITSADRCVTVRWK